MSRQPTVLICDDDKLVRWSLSEYLGRHAFRAIQAENGQDCLEKVEAHVPDIVLLDLRMPVMDGLTCLRKLRAAENDVPVIVLTAYGEVNSAIEATRLGATHYLTKPWKSSPGIYDARLGPCPASRTASFGHIN